MSVHQMIAYATISIAISFDFTFALISLQNAKLGYSVSAHTRTMVVGSPGTQSTGKHEYFCCCHEAISLSHVVAISDHQCWWSIHLQFQLSHGKF